eukprot:gene11262-12442_t
MYRRLLSPPPNSQTDNNTRYTQASNGCVEIAKITRLPPWKKFETLGETSQSAPLQLASSTTTTALNPSLGLYASPESKFRTGVLLRNNSIPIKEIRPFGIYAANKDALQSLQSLDHRLRKEFMSTHSPEPHLMRSSGASRTQIHTASQRHDSKSSRDISFSDSTDSFRQSSRQSSRHYHYMNKLPENADIVSLSPETTLDSLSINSSNYLDLSDLESSLNQSKQSRLSYYAKIQRPPSVHSDKYDNYSLASSSASCVFGPRDSYRTTKGEMNTPRFAEDHMAEVSKLVKQISSREGCVRNYKFRSTFTKICDVVNSILSDIPATMLPFGIKNVRMSCNYETVGQNSYEIYITPKIDKKDFEVSFVTASEANVFLCNAQPSLELFCVEDSMKKRRKLSPCKLMIIFAHAFNTSAKDSNVDGANFPHTAHVIFNEISEKGINMSIDFKSTNTRCKVSLILALSINSFPETSALFQHKDWPTQGIKQQMIKNGVHLIARLRDSDIHTWKVTFLKARQTLIEGTYDTGNKLRLLLVMQCLRETVFSQSDVILPFHLATILFWANLKYQEPADWTAEKLGTRFVDFIVALRRCLWKRECADFFVPNLNLFESMKRENSNILMLKIDEIIKNPLAFLKSRIK